MCDIIYTISKLINRDGQCHIAKRISFRYSLKDL